MTTEELRAKIDRIATDLGEDCESVRIFVTVRDEGSVTKAIDAGCGNIYAQLGQIHEWMAIQDQYQRNWAIRNESKDDAE